MTRRLAVVGSNLCGDVPFSVALALDGTVHESTAPPGERRDLVLMCRDLCRLHGVGPETIDEILIDVGPGSYTGLRVAVTVVRFLQAFGEVQVRCIDSLAILLRHASIGREPQLEGRQLRALLDARRGRYHTAAYQWSDGELVERESARAEATAELTARLGSDETAVMPVALADAIGDELRARGIGVVATERVTAATLFATGLAFRDASAEDLEPRYLMQSYAED